MGVKFVNNSLLVNGDLKEDSLVYQETVKAYLVEYLKRGNCLNLRLNCQILECIIDLIQKEAVYDILVVPVDVSHELKVSKITSFDSVLASCVNWLLLGPLFGQVSLTTLT